MNASAHYAAEVRRQIERQEEEELTPYTPDEVGGDWEFKILRSTMGGFRRPENLRRSLEDEGRAGWILVEKFDNNRIRLKRPTRARAGDAMLDFDPYRTHVGWTETHQFYAILILAAIGCVLAPLILMLAMKR